MLAAAHQDWSDGGAAAGVTRRSGGHILAVSLPESHTFGICALLLQLLQKIAIISLCGLGGSAMWIVMYVAMIASLSAMGMVPGTETGDPLPHDDA
jgi:hypothetical protein